MKRRRKTLLFKLAPTVIVVVIFLLGFVGRPEDSVWLNSSQIWQEGDPFFWEGSRALASPYFLYRGRPDATGAWPYCGVMNDYRHNEKGLRDDPIVDPKPASTVRILNIGDSSTWGLSLPDRSHTYSDRMEQALNAASGGRTYDVVNGGTIGYSSWQAARWLEYYIGELDPDVVTVFIGNNDSAPSGISDAKRSTAPLGPVSRALSHNAFYLLLQKAWLNLRERARDDEREKFMASLEDGRPRTKEEWYRASARVTPEEYAANLRRIVGVAREHGARVILLKVPMNLVWPRRVMPFLRTAMSQAFWVPLYAAEDYLIKGLQGLPPGEHQFLSHPWLCRLSAADVEAHLEESGRVPDIGRLITGNEELLASPEFDPMESPWTVHELAVAQMAREEHAKAVRTLRSLTEASGFESRCPASARADVHYALGVALLLNGQREEARSALIESRKAFPFAMSHDYEDAFDAVVEELAVEWIDLPSLFERADPDYFGSSMMHDWVHPSPAGSKIIADALTDLISK